MRPEVASGSKPISIGRGFTLLELLTVLGLMAALAVVLVGGLRGGGNGAALQSGQALLANLVIAARTRAMATGHRTRVLVNADPLAGPRFRRMLALQEETAAGTWVCRDSTALPEDIVVLPYHNRIPPGFYGNPSAWTKLGGSEVLESSSLAAAPLSVAADFPDPETWDYVQFVPAGTTGGSGVLGLAIGRARAPDTFLAGDSPVQLDSPDAVRGVALSAYGLPRLINDRTGF